MSQKNERWIERYVAFLFDERCYQIRLRHTSRSRITAIKNPTMPASMIRLRLILVAEGAARSARWLSDELVELAVSVEFVAFEATPNYSFKLAMTESGSNLTWIMSL